MQDSPHTARWIRQLDDGPYELHLFLASAEPLHSLLKNKVIVHSPFRVEKVSLLSRIKLLAARFMHLIPAHHRLRSLGKKIFKSFNQIQKYCFGETNATSNAQKYCFGETDATIYIPYGPVSLQKVIEKVQPDLIHSLEFQLCGYNVLFAREQFKNSFPKWLATNWGSDIYYFRRFPEHQKLIEKLLQHADYYSCECHRDVQLAKSHGFSGAVMPVFPNTGGFDLPRIKSLREETPASKRRFIMVKGYHDPDFVGRALTALEALKSIKDLLKNHEIIVFSWGKPVKMRVDELRFFDGMKISLLPYSSHEQMLSFFAKSRIYLGVNISDGISTSMLEAMAMGAFPIQTNTACCDEWIQDGKTGFSISPDDVAGIAEKLQQALTNDALVDTAAKKNWDVVTRRLDEKILREKALHMYAAIFGPQEFKNQLDNPN